MDFAELIAVIEEEILVGEELRRNLEEQKKALLAWDVAALLHQVDAREPWLRSLGELEQRRQQVMKGITPYLSPMTLRELIVKFPSGTPERDRLSSLQEGARKVFTRLQADERHVHGLIENLLAHIQEALSPLIQSDVSLYGETGVAMPRSRPGLIHGKA
jgi:flagellar biosynthesis/type III secretory pathway chaperone